MFGYISNINIYNQYKNDKQEYLDNSPDSNTKEKLLQSLFDEYRVSVNKHASQLSSMTLPTINGNILNKISELAKKTLSNVDKEKLHYLIYTHEMLEPPEVVTPSMKIKQSLKLKNIIPFSNRGEGSTGVINAVEILRSINLENDYSLVICADRICKPTNRLFYSRNFFGDSISSFIYHSKRGEFKIIHSQIESWYIGKDNIHDLENEDLRNLDEQLIDTIHKTLLKLKKSVCKDIKPVVVFQNYSNSVIQKVKKLTGNAFSVYERNFFSHVNFISSDPVYTLFELKEEYRITIGNKIILVFIGSLGSVGFLVLEYVAEIRNSGEDKYEHNYEV